MIIFFLIESSTNATGTPHTTYLLGEYMDGLIKIYTYKVYQTCGEAFPYSQILALVHTLKYIVVDQRDALDQNSNCVVRNHFSNNFSTSPTVVSLIFISVVPC